MIHSITSKTLAIVGAAALCLTQFATVQAQDESGSLDAVTVQLDYVVRGNHGMFYVAKEKGYFKENGIAIEEIRTGSGSPDALRTVGSGRADFGFGDLPSLAVARFQGVEVKALAAVNQASPLGMCSLAEKTTLDKVSDLEGHTVGVHPAGSTYIFYKALLASKDVDREAIKEVTVRPPYENYLLQGVVDAVVCYIDAEVPVLEDAAGGEGSLSILLGADVGYDAYGSGLFTSDQLIEDNSDLVERFVAAYMKAFEYVVDHPGETARILSQASPEQADNAGLFERQLKADIEHTFTSKDTKQGGLGTMTDSRWQATIDVLVSQDVIEGEPPTLDAVYDGSFLDSHHGDNQ